MVKRLREIAPSCAAASVSVENIGESTAPSALSCAESTGLAARSLSPSLPIGPQPRDHPSHEFAYCFDCKQAILPGQCDKSGKRHQYCRARRQSQRRQSEFDQALGTSNLEALFEALLLTVHLEPSNAAFDEARCETIMTATTVWNALDKSDRFRIRLPAKFEKESITIPSQDGFCKV